LNLEGLANPLAVWHDGVMVKGRKGDFAQNALRVVEETIGESLGKDAAAVSLGRRGGLKGGKARAAKLTPERRKQIASEAAKKRWAEEKG
jgi:hypothetical protein